MNGHVWAQAYDRDPAVIYALDADLRIVRCNDAWNRFAQENGAPELVESGVIGANVMDAVPDALHDFYRTSYDSVQTLQQEWRHVFECSSPQLFRSFQMRVVNTLLREEPHKEQARDRIACYTDADGIATMCSNCRRAEHLSHPGRWDFIPALLALNGVLVRPGLCSFCFHYHRPARSGKS